MLKKSKNTKKIHSKIKRSGKKIQIVNFKSQIITLKFLKYGYLFKNEIESVFKLIKKKLRKEGQLLLQLKPDITLTAKPIGVRMGKGKGGRVRGDVCFVKPGKVFIRLSGVRLSNAVYVLKQAQGKISIPTKIFISNSF